MDSEQTERGGKTEEKYLNNSRFFQLPVDKIFKIQLADIITMKPACRHKFWSTPRQNLSCAVCIFSGWNFASTPIYSSMTYFAHLLCKALLNLKV